MTTELATITQGASRMTEHLAARLTGMDIVDEHFVATVATIGADGYITVDVTRTDFEGTDGTARVLLHVTDPMLITPINDVELVGATELDGPLPVVEGAPELATPVEPAPPAAFVPAVGGAA